ncbi:uncharacterized protein BKA55DRAFT_544739 [Fusarium redolens]|uniref:SnoaL-like domain-containing protein n=1 Tax=Fusarium redolens TaxID=48865 RepID=A0A9P9JU99_FUSRE|nr:uncharacterized protein BKA55DRAFT_544739 [Fusarium redolens]KAH7232410.1 hypothetical protein BKA55DRAFT_544739 [Fusarium redolens]
MSSFITNGRYPPIPGATLDDVTSEERSSAIDFVNRHNLIFEEFDHQKMINTFLPDAVVYHTYGVVRGHENMKDFLENKYGFFIPGVSRHATNHVVDRDQDGGVIGDDLAAINGHDAIREDGLPAIWWIGRIVDQLRMTPDGWKIFERHLGAPFRDGRLDPSKAPSVKEKDHDHHE